MAEDLDIIGSSITHMNITNSSCRSSHLIDDPAPHFGLRSGTLGALGALAGILGLTSDMTQKDLLPRQTHDLLRLRIDH